MTNLNFIKSNYIIKKILISESLNKVLNFGEKEYIVLHDAVDIKNFSNFKTRSYIKKATYVGSFYEGRGIEVILHLAKKFPNINFELYGKSNNNFYYRFKKCENF